jgi:hypothetical protein
MCTQPETSAPSSGTCFVVMGFGKKTDFETGRVLDLNQSYHNLIRPAVEAAGLACVRADEIVQSGLIDVPMYEQLLEADVVVADLSTSNRNAIYELGVRHALRPYTTVVIAEEQLMKSPFFDLNHIVIRNYRHLGEDIGVSEMKRFTRELTNAIKEIIAREPRLRWDSPVYQYLKRLAPPSMEKERKAAAEAANGAGSNGGLRTGDAPMEDAAHSILMDQVDEAQREGDFLTAKSLLSLIRKKRKAKDPRQPADQQPEKPDDPYIIQRLALVTYKSEQPSPEAALKEARELLMILNPATSNETETLGLWGAVHKQLWKLTKEHSDLDESVRAYKRGFYLRNDYYNGINFAFLLNTRAAQASDPAEAIADFVQARRVRREVLAICDEWLTANKAPAGADAVKQYQASKYWVLATMSEAHAGLGEDARGQERLAEAYATDPAGWMKKATQGQLNALRPLLANSPLSRISAG